MSPRQRPQTGRHEERKGWSWGGLDHAAVAAAATESIRRHQEPYAGKHRGEGQA